MRLVIHYDRNYTSQILQKFLLISRTDQYNQHSIQSIGDIDEGGVSV